MITRTEIYVSLAKATFTVPLKNHVDKIRMGLQSNVPQLSEHALVRGVWV